MRLAHGGPFSLLESMQAEIERLPDVGLHEQYRVTLGDVTGYAYALPGRGMDAVEDLSNELLCWLKRGAA